MAPSKLNLTIYQGATFTKNVTWKTGKPPVSVDLSACTARMHIRATRDAADVLLELTTENARITLGDAAGTIALRVDAQDTTGLSWKTGVYDLEIEFPDGTVRRLLYGSVGVSPEVTRGV